MFNLKKLFIYIIPFVSVLIFGFSTYAASATITLSPNALGGLSSGFNSGSQFMFNFNNSPYMLPALYDEINYNLYQNFGYNIDDALIDMEDQAFKIWTGESPSPLPSAGMTPQIADWLSRKFTNVQNGVTASLLAGKMFFSQVLPNWVNGVSQNVRNYFIGEIDSESGVITSVSDNSVHKIIEGEWQYYKNLNDTFIEENYIDLISGGSPIFSKSLKCNNLGVNNYTSSNMASFELYLSSPVYFFTSNNISSSGDYYELFMVYDKQFFNGLFSPLTLSVSGTYRSFYSPTLFNITDITPYYSFGEFNINGVQYIATAVRFSGSIPFVGYNLYGLDTVKSMISNNVTSSDTVAYNYSSTDASGNSIDVESLLRSLIGKYIDAQTMDNVNSLVREFPVAIDTVNGEREVVLRPTQAQYDELVATVEGVIADQQYYDALFELVNTYDDVVVPDTEYVPNYGIDVPKGFPDIFEPFGEVVDSPNKYMSMFEPIFELLGEYKAVVFPFLFIIPLFLVGVLLFRFFL